jgi:hypothetical protein
MMLRYSIITTCKGRLHHLKQTLHLMVAQPDSEVIVVDYDCPHGTADWVAQNFPTVKTVRVVAPAVAFNLSDARNRGAAVAEGEFLLFVDADVMLSEDLPLILREVMVPGSFCRFTGNGIIESDQMNGSCAVLKEDFLAVGGYDDVLVGYAGEDIDLYQRLLRHRNARPIFLPLGVASVIVHSNVERGRYYDQHLVDSFVVGAAPVAQSPVWT